MREGRRERERGGGREGGREGRRERGTSEVVRQTLSCKVVNFFQANHYYGCYCLHVIFQSMIALEVVFDLCLLSKQYFLT